jgi:hypothetical protein
MKGKTDAELIASGGREVQIGGEPKVLFFNNLALCMFERFVRKEELAEELAVALDKGGYEILTIGLWAGLLHYEDERFPDYHTLGDFQIDNQKNYLRDLANYRIELTYAVVRAVPKEEKKAPLAKKMTAKPKSGAGKKN